MQHLISAFNRAYGDCLLDPCPDLRPDDFHDEVFNQVMKDRNLQWRAECPVPLATAAFLYSQLPNCDGWKSCLLPHLLATFPAGNIMVTPARENSTCMYIHIPDSRFNLSGRDASSDATASEVEGFVRVRFGADEVDWQPDGTLRVVWWD